MTRIVGLIVLILLLGGAGLWGWRNPRFDADVPACVSLVLALVLLVWLFCLLTGAWPDEAAL